MRGQIPWLLHAWAEEQERGGHPWGAHSGCSGCWAWCKHHGCKGCDNLNSKELSTFPRPSQANTAEDYCQERKLSTITRPHGLFP